MGIHQEFWQWFSDHSNIFYNSVKNNDNVEATFIEPLGEKLEQIKDGFYFLAGMCDENTAELVITADCNVANIVFVEELVDEAPTLEGWKITALKQPSPDAEFGLIMDGFSFDAEKLFFFSNDHYYYPDEIDITIVHKDLNEDNISQISLGVNIFLDNYLGELTYVNTIDNLKIVGLKDADKDLVPITKLKDFLRWRQKEFVEKYDGTWYEIDDDMHEIYEGALKNGSPYLATINNQLMSWERKASHPWVAIFTIKFESEDNYGMPDGDDIEMLDIIELMILDLLFAKDGNLYLGKETADNEREIYFVCKDFRQVSVAFFKIQTVYSAMYDISYKIYKDKYWQSFERYKQ